MLSEKERLEMEQLQKDPLVQLARESLSKKVDPEKKKLYQLRWLQKQGKKRIITGQESFEYNGKYYQIGSRLDDNANEIKHNRDFTEQLKNLGFTDPFDKNIPNGTTLTVKSDAHGSNEHNWKDWVGIVDITDWRNWIPGYNIYNQINNWANLESTLDRRRKPGRLY